jgi:hypothetical protein
MLEKLALEQLSISDPWGKFQETTLESAADFKKLISLAPNALSRASFPGLLDVSAARATT